ncbi:hypothetical protein FPV67DRAFT_1669825 [Lyophyllum atratum]|nr:hypothetical protein FPV67DRAFT_1669825 [Lyophyllum atratum]
MPPRKASKASTSTPRPLVDQMDGLSDDNFTAIFRSALAASSSDGATPISQPASPSKRKQAPAEELSPPSTPSPKKKQLLATTPGSAVIRAMASLTAEDSQRSPAARTPRARVPSAKAAAALAAKSIIALGPKSSSLTRVAVKKEPFDLEARALKNEPQPKSRAIASSPISLSSDDDDDFPPVSKLSRALFVDTEAVDDMADDNSGGSPTYEGTQSSGYLLDGFVRSLKVKGGRRIPETPSPPVTPARRANKLVLLDESADEEQAAPITSKLPFIKPERGYSRGPTDEDNDGSELVATDLPVMDLSLQDPLMKGAYDHLPLIKQRAFIEPYGYDKGLGSEPRNTIRISVLRNYMSRENLESLFRALLFNRHGIYTNMARADPSELSSSYRRITLKNGGAYTTCVMNGVVSSCDLAGPGVLAGSSNLESEKFLQHRISIFPFQQEIVRDIAAIFQVLQLPATGVKGTYSKGGFAFVTRGQGKRAALTYAGGYGVPKQQQGPDLSAYSELFAADVVPVAPSLASSTAAKSVLDYDDPVPIYDGRAETGRPFRFNPQDFSDLPSWRSYMNNRSDLPALSVVSIGYSANWYTLDRTNPTAQRYLSTNVLFVIVLNTPSSLVTAGGGSSGSGGKVAGKGKARA